MSRGKPLCGLVATRLSAGTVFAETCLSPHIKELKQPED